MGKLIYKVGDLIEAAKTGEVTVIAHQANCFHTMASGIAPLIKNAFPEAYEADLKTGYGDENKMGTCSYGRSKEYGVLVANIYGQHGFNRRGQDTDYTSLYNGLCQLRDDLLDTRDEVIKIGLPKLGCGLGGGDWNVVEAIIEKIFLDFFDVIVYVLHEKEIPDDYKRESENSSNC